VYFKLSEKIEILYSNKSRKAADQDEALLFPVFI